MAVIRRSEDVVASAVREFEASGGEAIAPVLDAKSKKYEPYSFWRAITMKARRDPFIEVEPPRLERTDADAER